MKICVERLEKNYPTQKALNQLSFELDDEETLCIMGESGSGKSTLLRCLCGLEKWDAGTVILDGKVVENIDPSQLGISLVFDEPRLIEHFNVFDNIALGLKYKGWDNNKINQRVQEIAEEMEMSEYLTRKPLTLSAGQKQRVALARALVRECNLLLLDEALNNLDEELKMKMIELLKKLKKHYHFSCLYVTHNKDEAKAIGDRCLILEKGKIISIEE